MRGRRWDITSGPWVSGVVFMLTVKIMDGTISGTKYRIERKNGNRDQLSLVEKIRQLTDSEKLPSLRHRSELVPDL